VLALRSNLEKKGLSVPRIVAGGTPTFPVFAKLDVPAWNARRERVSCTTRLWLQVHRMSGSHRGAVADAVISKPLATRLTLDLGYKAVASDPPRRQAIDTA